jgi:hypothetical protein
MVSDKAPLWRAIDPAPLAVNTYESILYVFGVVLL